MEYRVREFLGVFSIQCKVVKKEGLFWNKKDVVSWHPVTVFGTPFFRNSRGVLFDMPILETHKGLMSAFEEIDELKKGVVYHSTLHSD